MKIKACIENESKIQLALDSVNGKASSYTFNSAKYVIDLVRKECFEGELYSVIGTDCDKPGAQFLCTSSGAVCKSYQYGRKGTEVIFTRYSKDWFITDIRETFLYPNQGGKVKLMITEKQKIIAHNNLDKKFDVIREPLPKKDKSLEYNAEFSYDISIRGNILHMRKMGYGSSEEEAIENGKDWIRRDSFSQYPVGDEFPIVGEIVAFTYQGIAKNIKKHIILL
jgi:hypothetical protein